MSFCCSQRQRATLLLFFLNSLRTLWRDFLSRRNMTNSCKKERRLIIPNQGTILSECWHCWFDQSMTAAVYHALGSPLTSVSFQLPRWCWKVEQMFFFPCSSLSVGFSLISCCLYGFTYLRIKLKKVAGYCRKSQTENTLGQLLCQSFWKSLKGGHIEKRKRASKKPHALVSVWRICLHLCIRDC